MPKTPIKFGPLAGERYVPHFDGITHEPEQDHRRLALQLGKVYELMAEGAWLTLKEIAQRTGASEPSASARIRDLRKERFGGYTIERRRTDIPGVFEYRLLCPKPSTQMTFL